MTVKEITDIYDGMIESGKSHEEIESFLTASCREYDGLCPEDLRGRSALYNELGGFYRHYREGEKGLSAFLTAKRLLEDPKSDCTDTADYATTLNNLAGMYRVVGSFDKATEYFFRARDLYLRHPETPPQTAASCGNNLGLVYLDLGRCEDALREFETSLRIISTVPDCGYELAATYGNMYAAYAALGRKAEAVASLERGLQYAQSLGDAGGRELAEIYDGLLRRLRAGEGS